jgi:hypothetical protein
MTPADNVYYFGSKVDVRLCLKNGYTTLRTAWVAQNMNIPDDELIFNKSGELTHNGFGGTTARIHRIMKQQDLWDMPFRYGTERITVKRDPVQRFISAVSYLEQVKLMDQSHNKNYIDLTKVDSKDIDAVIGGLESWFLGDKNQYDKIYDITEMKELLQYLSTKVKMRVPVENLWKNRTKQTDKRITLTKDQEIRVVKLYAKDYANGWC